MSLHYPAARRPGHHLVVGPGDSPLRLLSFSLVALEIGEQWEFELGAEEAVIVVLGGRCHVSGSAGPKARAGGFSWKGIGRRENVFAGRATCVYLPPGSRGQIEAVSPLAAAVCTAPAPDGAPATLIRPEEVGVRQVGSDNWQREVHDLVGAGFPAARLLVGETFNPPGNWSSYPPHKHDEGGEGETELEEVYYFRVEPRQGFALQRVYPASGGRGEALVIEDGDTVVIPSGYHPVVAAPGYRIYYLWMLAGEERRVEARDDPRHAWMRRQEQEGGGQR